MDTGLPSLFIGSLLASTLVPGGVEVLLYFLYQSGEYSLSSLLWVATTGNTLGGIITFAMGGVLNRGLARFDWHRSIQRFFRLDDNALVRVRKWGVPVLFFSWMPIVGDPLCLAAGFLRLSVWPSIAMIFFSKLSRYAVLLWLFSESS
jgi:membrane protein YqaA with SNARE-associated domain